MCNCKKQVLNKLDDTSTIQRCKEVIESVGDRKWSELLPDEHFILQMMYNDVFPNSKGTPLGDDIITQIRECSTRTNTYYVRRK